MSEHDSGCICKGNWRDIVAEAMPLLNKKFRDSRGGEYIFFGVVHGGDDFYYGMSPVGEGGLQLLSCVGSFEGHGFNAVKKSAARALGNVRFEEVLQ